MKRAFCKSPTADEMLEGIDLSGKRVLITGCNAGIGFETAKSLARAGASVVLACRSEEKSRETAERIASLVTGAATERAVLDLSSLASVARFVSSQRGKPVDVLIGNAGLFPSRYQESADGIELCWAVCHVAHHALVRGLWSEIRNSRGRIVLVASDSHRTPRKLNFNDLPPRAAGYSPLKAYGQAKLANVLFANELRRRLRASGVIVTALHPGTLIATSITRDSLAARILVGSVKPFTKSVEQGAATTVMCAAAPLGDAALYYKDGKPQKASAEARDEAVAARLWDWTERLLVEHDFPLPSVGVSETRVPQ